MLMRETRHVFSLGLGVAPLEKSGADNTLALGALWHFDVLSVATASAWSLVIVCASRHMHNGITPSPHF